MALKNFVFEIIECLDCVEMLNEKEIIYIRQYKDKHLAYNLSDGGSGKRGIPTSERAKRIIGAKNKINMTGKKHSEETKAKMSKSRTGKDYTRYKKDKCH